MRKSLFILFLFSVTVQELSAQEKLIRQNILIERYADMSTPVVDDPSELKLEKNIGGIRSQVIRVNHYLSTHKDKIEVPFALEESQKYADYFSARHSLDYTMDRTKFYDDMEASISIHPESEDAEFYLWALQFPACVSVGMASEYDEHSRRLTVTVSGDVTDDLPYAKINLYLTQDDLYIKEIDKTEAIRHDDVLRAVLSSDAFGDDLEVVEGKYAKTYSYVIPEEINGIPCNPWNMSVIAFVADKNGLLESYVRNSAKQRIREIASVRTTSADNFHIYSDKGIVYIDGIYDKAIVYTIDGRMVKSLKDKNYFSLEEGLYFIKLNKNGEDIIRQVVVSK